MAKTITIDPVTRIEGHLSVKLDIEGGQVSSAYCQGEMFRGFEVLLKGRDPLDAQQITQRICGVCPVSHGTASVFAQEMAYGVTPPRNGRLMRNLTLGANYLQSHILHFYHLVAMDYVDVAAVATYAGSDSSLIQLRKWLESEAQVNTAFAGAPFLPRYNGRYIDNAEVNCGAVRHYLTALNIRAMAHQMVALFGGKIPHVASLVPGGMTEKPTVDKIVGYRSRLAKIQTFIDECYLPDLLAVAGAFPEYFSMGRGGGKYLAYGAFPEDESQSSWLLPRGVLCGGVSEPLDDRKITESVASSYFAAGKALHPSVGKTEPAASGGKGYSWVKAPRYDGETMEVGPLARVLVAYQSGKQASVRTMVDALLGKLNLKPEALESVLGRHVARGIEAKIIAERCMEWLDELKPGEPSTVSFSIPKQCQGYGLVEAPRGALGHWVTLKDGKIDNYQCVVPTTWNCSPRDDQGRLGAVEQSLIGTPIADEANPIEAARIVRSFDPCLACAIH